MEVNRNRIQRLVQDALPGAQVRFSEPESEMAKAAQEIYCTIERPEFTAKISFAPQTDDIRIMDVDVEEHDQRRKGMGKRVIGAIMAVAQDAGAKRLELYANEVGSYFWARAGFTPYPEEFAVMRGAPTKGKSTLHEHIDALEEASPETKEALHTMLEKAPDAKGIWLLADSQYGAELLTDYGYHAQLKLDDAKAVERFNTYTALSKYEFRQGTPSPNEGKIR